MTFLLESRALNSAGFPNTGMQVLSSLIHFIGVSFLAHCLSRTVSRIDSFNAFFALNWARICVILLFVDSWLFLFISGVLISGVGLDYNPAICSTAIALCIGCYGTSKLFIYCFLSEKVHVVWSPKVGDSSSRLSSPVYILCMITVACYGIIAGLLIAGRIHYFEADGACVVGLKAFASIPLLAYDLYVNIFLTALFLWPLLRSKFLNQRIRRVATRTLAAAAVALTTSTINVVVITILHGVELGWVCLASCGVDVFCNSLAIYWVTKGSMLNRMPTPSMLISSAKFQPSDRRLSADPATNLSGKRSTIGNCPVCSYSADQCNPAPSRKTAGHADTYPVDSKRYESECGPEVGRIAFAPIDVAVEGDNDTRPYERQASSANVGLNPASEVSQSSLSQSPGPLSRLRTLMSLINPFGHRGADTTGDIGIQITVTSTTEYEMEDRPASSPRSPVEVGTDHRHARAARSGLN